MDGLWFFLPETKLISWVISPLKLELQPYLQLVGVHFVGPVKLSILFIYVKISWSPRPWKGSELDIESPVFSRVFKLKPKPVESVRNINYINDTDDHGNSTCSNIHRLHRCTLLEPNSSHQKTAGFAWWNGPSNRPGLSVDIWLFLKIKYCIDMEKKTVKTM